MASDKLLSEVRSQRRWARWRGGGGRSKIIDLIRGPQFLEAIFRQGNRSVFFIYCLQSDPTGAQQNTTKQKKTKKNDASGISIENQQIKPSRKILLQHCRESRDDSEEERIPTTTWLSSTNWQSHDCVVITTSLHPGADSIPSHIDDWMTY